MACKRCTTEPVTKLPNSNICLCRSCFLRYFEKKVRKTIRKYNLVEKNDHIAVACSGDKNSITVLYLLNKIFKPRKDIKITAIGIDEGIKGYRTLTLHWLKSFCKKNRILLKIFTFKKEFGKTQDQFFKEYTRLTKHKNPCSVCAVLKRYLLNTKSKKLGTVKLATGHSLDDEAQNILMNQFRRDIKTSARLGPITGIFKDPRFVRRIKPLYFLTEKEIAVYAFLKGLSYKYICCPYSVYSYRSRIRGMLNELEQCYPGTKHNIIASFLEILPLLKKEYKKEGVIRECKICCEPCSQEVCQHCKLLINLDILKKI